MISINEVYNDVHSIGAKQQKGAPSPEDFDRYANMANIDLFNFYIEPIKDYYQLGKALPKRSVGMNKVIDQALRPFFQLNVPKTVVSGQAVLPGNVEYIDAVTKTYNTKQVAIKWVPFDDITQYQNSTIDIPDSEYPIYTDAPSAILVYPSDTPSVYLSYLKTPETVRWGYTVVNGRPVYNPATSLDFEWAIVQKRELIARICKYLGLSIRDQDLERFGTTEENTNS